MTSALFLLSLPRPLTVQQLCSKPPYKHSNKVCCSVGSLHDCASSLQRCTTCPIVLGTNLIELMAWESIQPWPAGAAWLRHAACFVRLPAKHQSRPAKSLRALWQIVSVGGANCSSGFCGELVGQHVGPQLRVCFDSFYAVMGRRVSAGKGGVQPNLSDRTPAEPLDLIDPPLR